MVEKYERGHHYEGEKMNIGFGGCFSFPATWNTAEPVAKDKTPPEPGALPARAENQTPPEPGAIPAGEIGTGVRKHDL